MKVHAQIPEILKIVSTEKYLLSTFHCHILVTHDIIIETFKYFFHEKDIAYVCK